MITVNQCSALEELLLYSEQFPADISQDLGSRIDVSSESFFGVRDPQKKSGITSVGSLKRFFFFLVVVGIYFYLEHSPPPHTQPIMYEG